MLNTSSSGRIGLAAFVLGSCIQSAIAQTAPRDVSQSPPGNNALEEITVTAQRRGNERLLDTPMSIGVLSGAALDTGPARGVSDALSEVGGVSVIQTEPGNTNIAVRGVVANENVGAPTTGFYLDEVPFAFIDQSQSPDVNAFDLQRVEVLRGPQGTLFGAGAMGGVVRILTNDPNLTDVEAKMRVTGSYTDGGSGNYGSDLALNVPLIPGELAIRGVASYSDLSGFISSDLTGQKRINDSELQSYRLKLDFKPSDELSVKLGLTHSRIDNGAPSTSEENLTTPFTGNQADSRQYDTYNLIIQDDLPLFSILSSTSYLKYQAGTDRVILLSGVSTLGYFNQYDLDSLAQEIRLTSKLSGSTQWTAGAYFKDSRENQIQNAVPTFPDLYDIDIRSKSAAVFGEVTQALGDRFELTGGLRYFHDDQLNTQASNFFPGALAPAATATFDHVTGRLVAKYTIDKDEIIYGSVSTGFRSGLNQAAAVISVDPAFPPLKPDSLVTYEVGNKANAFDGRLSYDLAAYFTDWKNTQQSLVLPVGFAAYVNAGNASGFGVDASAQYQATQNLALHASVGWNGLTFANNVQQTGTILFAKGERLNESPAVTAQIASDSHFPIGLPTVDGTLGGHLNYDSSQVNRFLAGSLLTETTSANIFSAGGELGVAAQRWSAELFAENIFNNREAVTPPDVTVDFQSIRLRPRTVGLRANTKF